MELKTLITGGSGFIGTNLVAALRRWGRTVLSLDSGVDILNARAVLETLQSFGPQEVVHLAARTGFTGRDDFAGYTVNTQGTRNVIAAIRQTPSVTRSLFASSIVAAFPPDGFQYGYRASKVEMEQIVLESKLPATVVRPAHVWGPWGGEPYRAFFVAIARGRYVNLGHNGAPKRLAYVGNVVHQIERLLAAPAAEVDGRTFYLADDLPLVISDWATIIANACGRRPPSTLAEPLVRLAATAGDALRLLGWQNPPLSSRRLANMRAGSPEIPLEETLRLTGRPPFTTDRGVALTVEWLREQKLI